jgi:hypothetical protein
VPLGLAVATVEAAHEMNHRYVMLGYVRDARSGESTFAIGLTLAYIAGGLLLVHGDVDDAL